MDIETQRKCWRILRRSRSVCRIALLLSEGGSLDDAALEVMRLVRARQREAQRFGTPGAFDDLLDALKHAEVELRGALEHHVRSLQVFVRVIAYFSPSRLGQTTTPNDLMHDAERDLMRELLARNQAADGSAQAIIALRRLGQARWSVDLADKRAAKSLRRDFRARLQSLRCAGPVADGAARLRSTRIRGNPGRTRSAIPKVKAFG